MRKKYMHKFFRKIVYCTLIFINLLCNVLLQNTKVIEVSTGFIQGKVVTIPNHNLENDPLNNLRVSSYLGIPYAESPTGINRFKAPIPKRRWNDILYAHKTAPICTQILTNYSSSYRNHMSEDCLFLNIYSPYSLDSQIQYPVIVYFHGGSYSYGSASEWPPYKLVEKNVVVVMVNYRLGVLGFFTTGDPLAPSNNGLRDQSLALEWVHANIKPFGGNPDQITIMGESAGGSAVGLHLLSPLSGGKGYIRSAVSMSGTELAPWALFLEPWEALNLSRILAQSVGCYHVPSGQQTYKSRYKFSTKTIECLRNRSPSELTQALINVEILPEEVIKLRLTWQPVVDGTFVFDANLRPFLPDKPEILLKQSRFPKIPYMLGMVENEESYVVDAFTSVYGWDVERPPPSRYSPFHNKPHGAVHSQKARQNFKKAIGDMIGHEWTAIKESEAERRLISYQSPPLQANRLEGVGLKRSVSDLLYYAYVPWADDSNKTALKMAFSQLLTDKHFTAPLDKSAKLHSDGGCPTFLYVFKYRPQYSTAAPWQGVAHGMDLPYFFGAPWLPPTVFPQNLILSKVKNWTDSDRNVSTFLISLLTNFVKYGDPTPTNPYPAQVYNPAFPYGTHLPAQSDSYPADFKWPPVKEDRRYYLLFDQEVTRIDGEAKIYDPKMGLFSTPPDRVRLKMRLFTNYRHLSVALWNGFVASLLDSSLASSDPTYSQYFSHESIPRELYDRYRAATWALTAVTSILAVILALLLVLHIRVVEDRGSSFLSPNATRKKKSKDGESKDSRDNVNDNIYVSPDDIISRPQIATESHRASPDRCRNGDLSRGSRSSSEDEIIPPDPLHSHYNMEDYYYSRSHHSGDVYGGRSASATAPKNYRLTPAPLCDKSQPM